MAFELVVIYLELQLVDIYLKGLLSISPRCSSKGGWTERGHPHRPGVHQRRRAQFGGSFVTKEEAELHLSDTFLAEVGKEPEPGGTKYNRLETICCCCLLRVANTMRAQWSPCNRQQLGYIDSIPARVTLLARRG